MVIRAHASLHQQDARMRSDDGPQISLIHFPPRGARVVAPRERRQRRTVRSDMPCPVRGQAKTMKRKASQPHSPSNLGGSCSCARGLLVWSGCAREDAAWRMFYAVMP